MKLHRMFLLSCIALLISSIGFGSIKHTIQMKALPLDGVPNVVMKTPESGRYLTDRVVVKLEAAVRSSQAAESFGVPALDDVVKRYGAQSVRQMFPHSVPPSRTGEVDLTKFYILKYATPIDPFQVAKELSALPEVQYAEPWFIYPVTDVNACTPNDADRSKQWGLNKILADSAFCITQGDTSIIIGIVDTGVQENHPDLQANIWHNPGEMGLDSLGRDKSTNGVDDDGNGKIDDWRGWDFGGADYANVVEDNNPVPVNTSSGHGTHVAGIAAATTDNSIGVSSIGNKCRILAVKASADNDTRGGGFPYIIAGFEGVVYAADMGARVINCSWGGSGASQTEQDFVNYATGKGALVVAAAGNGNVTTPSYPASYANVISVAATKQTDAKASYSSFGPTVDVSAPGGEPFNTPTVAIYSTDYDSTYGNSAGTSEATPFVSGLAALVASYFPGYSALQVGEQVRVTCDDINGVNPSYVNQLGKGRINAVRALTDSLPSLRMLSTVIKDSVGGNNNGILEPNEDFTITTNFINYLKPTTNAMVTLSTSDTNVQINSNTFAIGALGTMGVTDNSSSPFQVHVKSNPTPGHVVAFTLTISDGTYSDFQIFNVLINPTFATHDVNNVKVTFTNNGRIAFNDFPSNTEGVGFVFPAPSDTNHLFEGGLIIGNSATKLLNVIRNNSGTQDADFSSSQIYNLGTPDSISSPHQHGSTIFTDSLAPSTNKLGLKVYMDSYAFVTAPDNNYVLVRYVMRNTSASTISGLYIGLFFDWDMQPNYATNKTDYDTSRGLGYAWDNGAVNPIYCGARALSGAAGYRGLINSASNPLDLSRTSKWAWLSGGIVTTNVQEDIHFVLSSGPFAIASGATQMVGFAIVGGTDLTNLQANADAAQAKWNKLLPVLGVGEQPMGVPTVYSLSQNYPNPFNPSTHIRYELPKTSVVSLKVFDVLGREVGTLVNGEQTAGRYTVPFDGSRLASGLYFYRLVAGEYTAMKKLMLIK